MPDTNAHRRFPEHSAAIESLAENGLVFQNAFSNSETIGLMVTPLLKAAADHKPQVDRLVEAIQLIRTDASEDGEGLRLLFELQNKFNEMEELAQEIDRTEVLDPGVLDSLFEVVADLRGSATDPGVQI